MLKKEGLVKAISYRIYSTFITSLVAYLLTGSWGTAASIGLVDLGIKIFSYYFFDRIWDRLAGFPSKPAVIWLTGLSGAGKTTIAHCMAERMKAKGLTPVVLDGDEIRNAIRQFGFDEESRKKHNLNVGYIASLFEKQGNVVIVSLISPYDDVRNEVRTLCQRFIEVYVSTDLATCQTRDPKGLYVKALAGEIKEFTGISAPYYPPKNPELTLDTAGKTVDACVDEILKVYRG